MAKKLYAERKEFARWLATPDTERDLNTQKAFAQKHHLDEATVSSWRHDPEVIKEVNRLVDEHFGDEYAQMAEALKREARKGSYNHLRMYFEMAGKYTPKQEVEVSGAVQLVEVIRERDADA